MRRDIVDNMAHAANADEASYWVEAIVGYPKELLQDFAVALLHRIPKPAINLDVNEYVVHED